MQKFEVLATDKFKNKQIKQRLTMRIDKFLKVSRIIKRRTVAQEACDGNRIEINGKTASCGP